MIEGDLVSLRILLASPSAADRDLMRRGAVAASVPVEVTEAESGRATRHKIDDATIDVIFLDATIPAEERTACIEQAASLAHRPFVILVAATLEEAQGLAKQRGADSAVVKPADVGEAKALVERCARLRLPNRVLVVDDSLTMRGIVRKILLASRFRLEPTEAQEGVDALRKIKSGKFDLVFLDYNMPGLNGVETLAEIKRHSPNVHVVIMSSVAAIPVIERASRAGAAAFLKKPFYPADIDKVLERFYGLHMPLG
jgi:DNA-binding NtrC family response regulator